VIGIFLLTGCSLSQFPEVALKESVKPVQEVEVRNFHGYMEQVARQLFDTAGPLNRNMAVIIGTPVPSQHLKAESNPSLKAYGIQMQESLMTFTTQAGLKVVEFKSMPAVEIDQNTDLLLSRDSTKLTKKVHAQYAIAGTYTEQEHNLIVNIRLIRLSDSSVIAAATDSIPLDAIWSAKNIKLQNDKLYRSAY
jgi:TolB-like protein